MSRVRDYVAVEKAALQLVLNMLSRGTPAQQEAGQLLRNSAKTVLSMTDGDYPVEIGTKEIDLTEIDKKRIETAKRFEQDFLNSKTWHNMKDGFLFKDPNFRVDKFFEILTLKDHTGVYRNEEVMGFSIKPFFDEWLKTDR